MPGVRTMTELRKSCSRRLAHLCLWTTLLGMPCALADEHGIDVGASLALRSDSLFRGVSQTLGSAAVEGSVDVAFESGFYAYAWASNVDFEPDSEPDDGARLEVDVALGYTHDLNDRWAVDVELVRYIYPGTVAGANYDYNELLACLWLDERYHATVGYSEHVFGMDAAGL